MTYYIYEGENILNKFNSVYIDEEQFNGFQIIETRWDKNGICKRCGKSFIKKYKDQKFCSRDCSNIYHKRTREMKEKYSKKFTDWLNDKIDCSYSPEKF